MIFVIQRVTHADVTVENKVVGKIGHGLLVFVGVADFDNQQTADKMIDKPRAAFHIICYPSS